MSELLGALGLAWPRLLLYPGGLFALLAARLLGAWLLRCGCMPRSESGFGQLAVLLPALATVSLLPLAPARSFPFGLDLAVAFALLTWSYGLGLHRSALVRVYGPLLLAALGFAAATGGLELSRLLRLPESGLTRGIFACATALWLLGLPRLLALRPGGIGGDVQALGLLLIAALPVLGGLAVLLAAQIPADRAGWVLPLLAIAASGLALGAATRLPEQARTVVELALGAAILAGAGALTV
jgi:hypothetical protein